LIHAQESTRAAIARDLHDDVCHELVTVALGVSTLKATSHGLSAIEAQQALSSLQDLTMDSVDRVRRLSHDLHPATLRTLGLRAALRSHCIEVEKRYDVQVNLDVSPDVGSLPADASLCLFRITQEALRNGAVHGDARRLSVALSRQGDQVELQITDDGNGFDVESVRRGGSGLGLVSMEERAHLADGVLTVTSRIWHGTTVRVQLRLPADDTTQLAPATLHLPARAS
jgi:two-component system sensor histidine kinase UhpB